MITNVLHGIHTALPRSFADYDRDVFIILAIITPNFICIRWDLSNKVFSLGKMVMNPVRIQVVIFKLLQKQMVMVISKRI